MHSHRSMVKSHWARTSNLGIGFSVGSVQFLDQHDESFLTAKSSKAKMPSEATQLNLECGDSTPLCGRLDSTSAVGAMADLVIAIS